MSPPSSRLSGSLSGRQSASQALTAAEQFGDFILLRKLATGGMAEVFLARRRSALPGFTKLLAIKRMLPHLAEDPEFITMFMDEARTASHLNHPNIVQIFDVGEAMGTLYLAMEYLDGVSIMTVLQRNIELRSRQVGLGTQRFLPPRAEDRPLDPLHAAAMGMQACLGLHYAHQLTLNGEPMGLVHRDISPQNLMLTYGGVMKLLDFGIAKAAGRASVTRTGALKGKVRYMAPEQFLFQPVDQRTDVYSLGVVLYELCTASRAFSGEDWEIVQQVQGGQIPDPQSVRAEIPTPLARVIMRAIAPRPDDRYSSAAAFGDALLQAMRSLGKVLTSADLAKLAQSRFGDERLDIAPYMSSEHMALSGASRSSPQPLPIHEASEAATALPTRLWSDGRAELAMMQGGGAVCVGSAPPAPALGPWLGTWVALSPKFRPRHFWLYPMVLTLLLTAAFSLVGLSVAHVWHGPQSAPQARPAPTAPERRASQAASPAGVQPGPATPAPTPLAGPATPATVASLTPAATPATVASSAAPTAAPAPAASPAPAAAPAPAASSAVPTAPPAPAPTATPAPAPAKTAAPPASQRGASQRSTPGPVLGYLVIDSKPAWSRVYAHGRLLGQTPIVKRSIPAGWTNILVVNGQTHAQRTVRVLIKRGEVTTTLVRWQ